MIDSLSCRRAFETRRAGTDKTRAQAPRAEVSWRGPVAVLDPLGSANRILDLTFCFFFWGGLIVVELSSSGDLVWQRELPGQTLIPFPADTQVAIDVSGAAFLGSTSQTLDLGGGPPLAGKKGLFVAKLSP